MIPSAESLEQNIQSLQFARILIAQGLVSFENFPLKSSRFPHEISDKACSGGHHSEMYTFSPHSVYREPPEHDYPEKTIDSKSHWILITMIMVYRSPEWENLRNLFLDYNK